MWLHKNGQADKRNSSHSRKCLYEFTTVQLRKNNESYFEFSNYSVLVCDVLVVIISTFSSEQAETVQPVLKVVKLTLQFLWVHLIGPKHTSKNTFLKVLLLTVVTVQHLQLLQLWLLLLCRLCHLLLLLLAFASFAAFHWRVISFDF